MKLRTQDLRLFNLVFESDAGWIMDFSNRTLSAFFDEELNIDIDDERYCEDGASKAKRVRCLLKKADRETVLQVLSKLWEYKVQFHPGSAEATQNDYFLLISRLSESGDDAASGEKPVPSWHHIDYGALTAEMDRMKMLSPHERGFRFEAWLGELFHTFHLAPRKSFRNTGEQIDGSFRLNNEYYLMEAKWHQKSTPAADLHVFVGKLSTKAAWTRGVFISWRGFTPDGLTAFGKGTRVICVDGYDLYHSLKKRYPSPTSAGSQTSTRIRNRLTVRQIRPTGHTDICRRGQKLKFGGRENRLNGFDSIISGSSTCATIPTPRSL